MTPERWQQIKGVLDQALDLKPEQRTPFVNQACDGDPDLRHQVASLLVEENESTEGFLRFPVEGALKDLQQESASWVGHRIGSYEIIELIGEGGMGAVYRAARADEQYKKQVAIKMVKLGLGTPSALARFRAERQILANLEHSNIARLLDGGTTENGLPYVVMELVEGQPIDEYCRSHELSIEKRLGLFRTVCLAVQYAHQRLVIHRDLKPENILVTPEGTPKLLDFGIAKILDPESVQGRVDPTLDGMRLLTPSFASPEQVRGQTVTTASDVYSLGVILFVLLTGHSPYRLQSDSLQEMIQAVCETDPEKPSVAVTRSWLLAGSSSEPESAPSKKGRSTKDQHNKLQKILEGDLDNIVVNALRKEPSRRYSSVDQFSEDIRRYLAGLPILAQKDAPGYRARKFIGRHKWGVAAVVLLILSLSGGMIATLWQARKARAERVRAERRFNDVRTLANSLIFDIHDSIRDLPGATAARQTILNRAQQYLDSLAAEARHEPVLLRELAVAYARLGGVLGDPRSANLGNSAKALENYRKAVELAKESAALQPGDIPIRRELAEIYTELSIASQDPIEEKSARQEARALLEPMAADPKDLASQVDLARIEELNAAALTRQKDLSAALQAYEKSLALYQGLAKADPGNERYRVGVSFGHKHVGSVLSVMNRLDEALDHYRQALAIDEVQLAAHPDNLNARFNITYTYSDTGFILRKRGDLDGALSYYRKALDIRSALAIADPRDARTQRGLGNTYEYIAQLLQDRGDYPAALEAYEKSSSIWESLAQRDPADRELREEVSFSRSYIGETYAVMATAPHVSRAKQILYCRKAIPLFEPSLSENQRAKAEGKLGPGDLLGLAELQKAHDQCAARLATPAP